MSWFRPSRLAVVTAAFHGRVDVHSTIWATPSFLVVVSFSNSPFFIIIRQYLCTLPHLIFSFMALTLLVCSLMLLYFLVACSRTLSEHMLVGGEQICSYSLVIYR